MLIRSLKGAALSCYLVLHLAGSTLGTDDLVSATGYSPNSVRAGLRTLESLQLAVRVSRYNGWTLARGTQLLLPHPDDVETVEDGFKVDPQNLRVDPQNLRDPCSSSTTTTCASTCNSSLHEEPTHEERQQQHDRDPQNLRLPLPDDLEPAVEVLIGAGAKPARARAAVRRAAQQWSPARVEEEIEDWLDYCRSQESVHYPAGLTCARISDAVPAPERPPETADEKARRYIQQAHDRIVQH
jgi:hypothetical protein